MDPKLKLYLDSSPMEKMLGYPPQPTVISPATERILSAVATGSGKVSVRCLDRRMTELLTEIYVLRQYRNALSFPNQLPIELLGEIFLIYRDVSVRDQEGQDKATWLKLTHICRHWRDVALNLGPFWSKITFAKTPELTKAMLARSQNLPLTVYLHITADTDFAKGVQDVLSQARRLQFVKLVSPVHQGSALLTQALRLIGEDSPILEELELLQTGSGMAPLPKKLLQGNTPNLKRLIFQRIDIRWGMGSWPASLTHLKISQCPFQPHEFSKALSRMGSLMTLDISRCISLDPPFTYLNIPTIPSLRTLDLNEPAASIHNFLSSVRIPQIAHLSVISHDRSPTRGALTGWLGQAKQSLSDSENALDPPALANLNMCGTTVAASGDFKWHTSTRITFHRIVPAIHPSRASSSPFWTQQRLDFSFDEEDLSPLQSLESVRDTFPLTTLTSLRLEALHHLKPEEAKHFYGTFAECPNLAEVSLKEMPIMGFLMVLEDRSKNDKPPPFPKLKRITFFGINWRERRQPGGLMLRRLIELVDKRSPDNLMEQLCFTNCRNAFRSDIDTLKQALPEVDIDWDDKQSLCASATGETSADDDSEINELDNSDFSGTDEELGGI